MKFHLGGIVCLLLPGLALAQDGGAGDGFDARIGEATVRLVRSISDQGPLPLGAARVLDGEGRLLLAGGVEAAPGAVHALRVWDPELRRFVLEGSALSDLYLPEAPIAATWVDAAQAAPLAAGLLTLGTGVSAAGGDTPLFFFAGKPLPLARACDPLPPEIGAPIFVRKPTDLFGHKSTRLLFVQATDRSTGFSEGQLFGVELVQNPSTAICLTRLLANTPLPATHLLGGAAFDPEADGGNGALILAGGVRWNQGTAGDSPVAPTVILSSGEATPLPDWRPEQHAADVMPLPGGGLLLTVIETGSMAPRPPLLVEAHWDPASGRHALGDRAIPTPVSNSPPRADIFTRLSGSLMRMGPLPGTDEILVIEHATPETLEPGGYAVVASQGREHRGALFSVGTLRLFATQATLKLYPNANQVFQRARLFLDDVPFAGLSVTATPDENDPTSLDLSIQEATVQPDGGVKIGLSAGMPGPTRVLWQFSDPSTQRLIFTAIFGVEVKERESLYQGFRGCATAQTPAPPSGATLLLSLLALCLLARSRRRLGPPLLALFLLWPATLWADEATEESGLPSLAFLGVTAGAGVDEATAEAISDYIQTLTAATGGYRLIRITEIRDMLGFEAQRQLLGCSDDTCISDLAGALDVDRLLRASVSRLGESMMIQLTLLDGRESRQIAATGMRLEKSPSAEPVLDVMPELLGELFEADSRFDGKSVRHKRRNIRTLTRERRWSFGAGTDIDLSHPGALLLGVHIAYRGRYMGFGLGFLPRLGDTPSPGDPVPVALRAEIRLRLFDAGPVHPQLAVGATYFPRDLPLPRIALHTEIDLHRWVRAFVSIAGEVLPTASSVGFNDAYLLLSFGLAVTP